MHKSQNLCSKLNKKIEFEWKLWNFNFHWTLCQVFSVKSFKISFQLTNNKKLTSIDDEFCNEQKIKVSINFSFKRQMKMSLLASINFRNGFEFFKLSSRLFKIQKSFHRFCYFFCRESKESLTQNQTQYSVEDFQHLNFSFLLIHHIISLTLWWIRSGWEVSKEIFKKEKKKFDRRF